MLSCPPAPPQAHNLHRTTADSLDTTRRRPSRPHSHFNVQKSRYKSSLGSVHARLHTFRAVTGRWACLRRPRPACAFLRARSSDAGSQARAVLRGGPRRQASVLISVFLEPMTHCRWSGADLEPTFLERHRLFPWIAGTVLRSIDHLLLFSKVDGIVSM